MLLRQEMLLQWEVGTGDGSSPVKPESPVTPSQGTLSPYHTNVLMCTRAHTLTRAHTHTHSCALARTQASKHTRTHGHTDAHTLLAVLLTEEGI